MGKGEKLEPLTGAKGSPEVARELFDELCELCIFLKIQYTLEFVLDVKGVPFIMSSGECRALSAACRRRDFGTDDFLFLRRLF